MEIQINLDNGSLQPLCDDIVAVMCQWEYEAPYHEYSFNLHQDDYLLDKSTWGTEQFCFMVDGLLVGQVACQFESDDLWVGWSMAPEYCGHGYGADFVEHCVKELRRITNYHGRVLLRVSARNKRAIKAYQKAGFTYVETIQDEIAYSNHMEDFWVMQRVY